MQSTTTNHNAMSRIRAKPKGDTRYLLDFDFRCKSDEEVKSGLKEFEKKVKSVLDDSLWFKGEPMKVSKVEMSKGRTLKGRTKITLDAYFELATKDEAHYFFSAEATHITSPDTLTLIGLMAHGSGVLMDSIAKAASSKASNFKAADHGHVKFFDTFETEIMFQDKKIYYYTFSFASAKAAFQSGSHGDLRKALRKT